MQYQLDIFGNYVFKAPVDEETLLAVASQIREQRFFRERTIHSPSDTRDFLIAKLALREREVFAVIFLDTRHGVLAFEELFSGTIDAAEVHPREIVRRALHHNAAAVILAHNHPSGVTDPSTADCAITRRLRDALALVGVRVLDHVVVGGNSAASFAEKGLL